MDVPLPMIFADDLVRGLVALQDAEEKSLREPERGYALPGLSFTPRELFSEIRRHVPDFKVTVELDPNMSKFARLWPDTLSTKEALEDLGYSARVGLPEVVEKVIAAHRERLASEGA
uniref:NAD-dependent epimerase/dehydratase domain-containing protein n=1 Tax=Alexandrium catenella TaxID=2925 RepID=A0A7S1QFF3_ALECA